MVRASLIAVLIFICSSRGLADIAPKLGNYVVQYHPWKILLGPQTVKDPENSDSDQETITFYGVGIVDGMVQDIHGQLLQAELIISKSQWLGQGKDGFGAADTNYRRYIRVNKTLYYLPLNSSAPTDFSPGTEGGDEILMLGSNGYVVQPYFGYDGNNSISGLLCPKLIRNKESGLNLEFITEAEGTPSGPNLDKVRPAFLDPAVGQVFTTKSDIVENQFYFLGSHSTNSVSKSLLHMEGLDFLTTNGFFVFRPDGTFLVYREVFDWEGSKGWKDFDYFKIRDGSLVTNDGTPFGSDYSYQTKVGCLDRDFNNFCGVTDERQFSKDDLVIYGHLSRTASPIYKIKYATHPYYRKFYEAYLKNFGDWFYSDRNEKKTAYSKPDLSIQDQDQPVSFGEFVSNVPILFYKDPIGRWIQLLHREFLPPAFCEPVIYLYPTHTTMVNVRVEPPGGVTESAPSYSEGWNVLAHPDGKLSVNGSNLSADYLFWEGHSFLFPMCPQGVVVARDSVKAYLDGALPSLGLSKSEALDFERAWLFKLQEKSFCFITFYCGDSVEKMAPLEIQPKPDTVMRILMDFRPLDHWVSVSEPAPFSHVDRHGFTVVEWGGLER